MKRRHSVTGPEALEARDQPAAGPLADLNPVGTSALRADTWSPGHNPTGVFTKSAAVFEADDGVHRDLWATDGTPTGAVFLGVDQPYGGGQIGPVAVGDRVFFFDGTDVWVTDGRP